MTTLGSVFIGAVDSLSLYCSLELGELEQQCADHDRESSLSSPACGWEDNHTGRSLSLKKWIVHNGGVDEHSG